MLKNLNIKEKITAERKVANQHPRQTADFKSVTEMPTLKLEEEGRGGMCRDLQPSLVHTQRPVSKQTSQTQIKSTKGRRPALGEPEQASQIPSLDCGARHGGFREIGLYEVN